LISLSKHTALEEKFLGDAALEVEEVIDGSMRDHAVDAAR
jgi:hypothetical protein